MIPKTNTVKVETFGGAQSRQMTIDASSIPHLMTVLGNLYSDSILAIVREYSTNAMDSHIAAGTPEKPITVKLPTLVNPTFAVSDEGVGLTEDQVYDIYGSYGASTKRLSNDFNGQLGFGCKSAFSYTDQFTVTTIKDGYKKAFIFSLDENGIGSITKMGEETSSAHDGVTVSIPVKNQDVMAFCSTAATFYSYWVIPPVGVTLPQSSGKVIEVIDGLGHRVVSEIENLSNAHAGSNIRIVMGNVAYPVPAKYISEFVQYARQSYFKMNIYVNMGEVEFTPSREEIKLTPNITTILKNAHDAVLAHVKAETVSAITNAPTLLDAISLHSGFKSAIFSVYTTHILNDLMYKTYDLSLNNHKMPNKYVSLTTTNRGFRYQYGNTYVNQYTVFMVVPNMVNNAQIAGYKDTQPLGIKGLKIKETAGLRSMITYNSHIKEIILVNSLDELPDDIKIMGIPVYTVADIDNHIPARAAAVSTPRKPRGLGLYTFNGFKVNLVDSITRIEPEDMPDVGSEIYAVEMDGYKPLFRKSKHFNSSDLHTAYVKFLQDKNAEVYAYKTGNSAKIKAAYTVIPLEEALEEYLIDYMVGNKSRSQYLYEKPTTDMTDIDDLRKMFGKVTPIEAFADPDLTEAVYESIRVKAYYKIIEDSSTGDYFDSRRHKAMIDVLEYFKGRPYVINLIHGFYPDDLNPEIISTVIERYPLLTHISHTSANIESVREYVNSVYIASHKEK